MVVVVVVVMVVVILCIEGREGYISCKAAFTANQLKVPFSTWVKMLLE